MVWLRDVPVTATREIITSHSPADRPWCLDLESESATASEMIGTFNASQRRDCEEPATAGRGAQLDTQTPGGWISFAGAIKILLLLVRRAGGFGGGGPGLRFSRLWTTIDGLWLAQ